MRNIGSTIAIILGTLYFIGSLAKPSAGLITGPIMILGALAYRSAKYRRTAGATWMRLLLEAMAILAIIVLWLGQHDLKIAIATDPLPNALIPIWALIAYGIAAFRKSASANSTISAKADADRE